MTTATMSYGMRARERMPFAWDYITLGLVASLLLVGLIMVTSASMSIAARDLGNPFFFLERQFIFGALRGCRRNSGTSTVSRSCA
jgi:cell division protein FtsW (lipid II flippase)